MTDKEVLIQLGVCFWGGGVVVRVWCWCDVIVVWCAVATYLIFFALHEPDSHPPSFHYYFFQPFGVASSLTKRDLSNKTCGIEICTYIHTYIVYIYLNTKGCDLVHGCWQSFLFFQSTGWDCGKCVQEGAVILPRRLL